MRKSTLILALVSSAVLSLSGMRAALAAPDQASAPPAKISDVLVREASAKQDNMQALALYESALVANPKNTAALVGLGQVYQKMERMGDSLRYYQLALDIDPNDISALEAQSMAYVAGGRLADAEHNLNRLRRICVSGCAALDRVNGAIAKALDEKEDKYLGRAGGEKTAANPNG